MAKTKLTADVHSEIVKAIEDGNTYEVAARCAGIDPRTVERWKERGAKASSGVYHAFYEACMQARAKARKRNVGIVQLAATGIPTKKVVTKKYVQHVIQRDENGKVQKDGDGVVVRVPVEVVEETVTETLDIDWTAARWWLEKMDRENFGPPAGNGAGGTGGEGDKDPQELARKIAAAIHSIDDLTDRDDRSDAGTSE